MHLGADEYRQTSCGSQAIQIPETSKITTTLKRIVRSGVKLLAKKASRNYIAGPELQDAHRICSFLSERGYWVTQGYWNSADDTPSEILQACQGSIDDLVSLAGNNYLSIKIPSLDYDTRIYAALLNRSRETGVAVHFDSIQPEHAGRIFSFIQQFTEPPFHDIGCTLPGRWRRSVSDADLVNELQLNVRVVKGQYEDPEAPDTDPRGGFLQVIERLAGNARCVRVASHDVPLAQDALERLKEAGTNCELELIYGLPMDQLVPIALRMGVPVRVYVAFGHAYLPYALSGLRKNPKMMLALANEAFKRNYLSSIPPCSID